MQNFRELRVWQRSHQLALSVYHITTEFPKHELYGLTSQMRRSATSVPTNIAEGCGRNSGAELAWFLQVAMGSASELEYQLLLAHDLNLLSAPQHIQLETELIEIKRMLNSFLQKLRAKN